MLRLLLPVVVLVLLAGCGSEPGEAPSAETGATAVPVATTSVTGTDGVSVEAADLSRIVTLGGPVTEIVYALGLGDQVVGTDVSSAYPAEVQEKPRLGYFRQVSTEGILSLEPTLVLALDGMGPPTVAEQLRTAGVPVLLVEEAETLAGAEGRLQTLGAVLGRSDEAAAVWEAMQADLAEAEALRPATPPRALFVYARGASLVNVSGSGTAAELVMQLAGAENAVTGFEDFQALTAEAAFEAAPDVIVVPRRGMESVGGADGLLALPGLAQTPAGQQGRVIAVDDALLIGLGPRMGEGVRQLAEAFSALDLEVQSATDA
ncbi:MAG: ABC transporter substrate-binding protein [Bacteroidota bacterium]